MLDEPILSKTACQSTKMVDRETICKLNKLLLQPGSNNMTPSLDEYSTLQPTQPASFEILYVLLTARTWSPRSSRGSPEVTNESSRANECQTILHALQRALCELASPPSAGAVTTLKTISGYYALEHVGNDYPDPKISVCGFLSAENYLSTSVTEPINTRGRHQCMRASAAAAGDPNLSELQERYTTLEHVPNDSGKPSICYKHPIVVPYLYSDGASARAAGGPLCMHSAAARAGDTLGAMEAPTDALGGSTRASSPPPTLTDAEPPNESPTAALRAAAGAS